jgi:hypothetical protein
LRAAEVTGGDGPPAAGCGGGADSDLAQVFDPVLFE